MMRVMPGWRLTALCGDPHYVEQRKSTVNDNKGREKAEKSTTWGCYSLGCYMTYMCCATVINDV